MDAKTFATEGEFDGGKAAIGENFVRWYYLRRRRLG
jgi:hypothetical protein